MSASARAWIKPHESRKGTYPSHLSKVNFPTLARSPIDQITFLQTTVGNRGMGRLLRSKIIQAKLKVNQPGDVYEREADRISDQVLATPKPAPVSGAPGIQRVVAQPVAETAVAPASVDHVLASAGKSLDPTIQREMEGRFGFDFSRVRVHTGPAAEQSVRDVNARAYTVGDNLVFGAGEFKPDTRQGRRLLAHELTHVAQQSGAAANVVRRSNGFEDLPTREWPRAGTVPEPSPPGSERGHVERGGQRIPGNSASGEIDTARSRGPTPGGGGGAAGGGAAGAGAVEGASVLGGGAGAVFAGAVPVIAMVGVFVALGSGYAAAREAVRNENTVSGLSQGFVMGLLGWEWRHVVDRFGRWSVIRINAMDEATDVIRVNAYNRGLRAGYDFAARLSVDEKKAYLSNIRKFGGIRVPKNWNRNRDAQISYVIELAAAAVRSFLKRE
jgi:Domain of unknown function (DUF4157)